MISASATRNFLRDSRGAAAVEFAIFSLVLAYSTMNAVDIAFYTHERMEVAKAAQVAAETVWSTCNNVQVDLPATQNCPGLNAAIQTAICSTGLGQAVSLANAPTEGYYCVNASGSLQQVGSLASKPADCSAVGSPTTSPGDYVLISTTASYSAFFRVSVMGVIGLSSITQTSWMRVG